MAHAVSALYAKFNHMSPTAAALAALLHVLVALAFLWGSPLRHVEAAENAIEFTVPDIAPPPESPETPPPAAAEAAPSPPPSPPPPSAQAPAPAPTPAPTATPTPQPSTASRLGLAPPRSLTPDPRAVPAAPQPDPKPPEAQPPQTSAAEPAKPEPATPEPAKPEPEPQQAAAAPPEPPPPPAPPEPKLEQVLPPLDAPPPPVTARDIPRLPPPPPPPPARPPQVKPPPQAQPQPRAQTPPQQALQPSPLGGARQQRAPGDSQAAAQPSPLTNPASVYGLRKVEDDYLWQVNRIISQHQQFVRNVSTEQGSVVLRMTVARDGQLIDASLAQSSGIPALDTTVLNLIRQAGPYPRLPPEITGPRHTFVLPLHFRRSG